MILIHQSRPFVVTSREKGIGPGRDPPYRFVHEVRQWSRRSEESPGSGGGSSCSNDRWGPRECTFRHTASDRVQLEKVGRRRHRCGTGGYRRQTNAEIHIALSLQTNRRSGNRLPGTGVATAGIFCCFTKTCSGSRHHLVVVVQPTVRFIKRRRGRRPGCQ